MAGMANAQSARLSNLLSSEINTGTNPNQFDAGWYLQNNPDVAASGMDAYQHYLLYGQKEGRAANSGIVAPSAGDPTKISGIPAPPTSFDPGGQQQTSFNTAGQQQTGFADVGGPQSQLGYTPGQVFGFGGAGDVTSSYGPGDFSADRQNVQDSLMARINPQLAVEKNQLTQQLADQGIRYGSTAYTNAMDNYNRQSNDARFAAINQAGTEQQRMMDMAAQRAGFQNAAQQQQFNQQQQRGTFFNTAQQAMFGQNLQGGQFANTAQQQAYEQAQGRGTFANTAQAQQFGQNQQAATFANQAQQNQFMQNAQQGEFAQAGLAAQVAQAQSGFNAQNMARNQFMNEQYAMRNQPINEISSLLSGSQINNPNFVNTPNNQIPTTDVAGLINTRFNQDFQNYQQQSQQQQALMGGIFGMLGGMAKMSDERMKENKVKIGSVFATEANENESADSGPIDAEGGKSLLPIYSYTYKGDPSGQRHVGPMAQDVEKIDRGAVKTHRGIKYINPGRIMGNVFATAHAAG
jgi:hypothetical protein